MDEPRSFHLWLCHLLRPRSPPLDLLHPPHRPRKECGGLGGRFQEPGRKWYILLLPTFHWLERNHMIFVTAREAGKQSLSLCREEQGMGLEKGRHLVKVSATR